MIITGQTNRVILTIFAVTTVTAATCHGALVTSMVGMYINASTMKFVVTMATAVMA